MIRVKICGVTHLSHARLAAEAGADWLGFVFYPSSPRYISPHTVRSIVTDVKSAWPHLVCVGVFVDEEAETVREVLDFCGLDRAQLHGQEPPEHLSACGGQAYKAIRPRSLSEAEASLARYAPLDFPPDLLVDAFDPQLPGGSGRTSNWELAAHLAARRRILLAGGLSPDNVAEAIQFVRPWGVDVSSGVEASPGRKSPHKLRAFIAAVREAQRRLEGGDPRHEARQT